MDAKTTQNTPAADTNSTGSMFSATDIAGKKVVLNFEGGSLSSDGGAILLREVEEEIGVVAALAVQIKDKRDQAKIDHTLLEMMRQRILLIACGYEDANDSATLRTDPVFKMAVGRAPIEGDPLASQPTISRLENSIDKTTNDRLEQVLVERFIASYAKPPQVIVIDADQTCDRAHGCQEEILFNNYIGEYCFMPLHIYEGLSGKLITALLMPGKRPTGAEMLAIIKPLIEKMRAAWPDTLLVFRGDSHFSYPEVHAWIDEQPLVQFVTGLGDNNRLRALAQSIIDEAERRYAETKVDVCRFHTVYYQADSWAKLRRVVVKVEVTGLGTNVRYVVTSLETLGAKYIYRVIYCDRGRAELYIKDHKTYLKSDRTSCHSFQANRFRLLMHSAAYVLLHSLRAKRLAATQWATATMETIRRKFLKIAVRVCELKTRIKVEFPSAFPEQETLRRCFQITEAPEALPQSQ